MDRYNLIIRAEDDGSCCAATDRLTSSATFVINIVDANRNKPVFSDCNKYDKDTRIEEEKPAGFPVLQVRMVMISLQYLFLFV